MTCRCSPELVLFCGTDGVAVLLSRPGMHLVVVMFTLFLASLLCGIIAARRVSSNKDVEARSAQVGVGSCSVHVLNIAVCTFCASLLRALPCVPTEQHAGGVGPRMPMNLSKKCCVPAFICGTSGDPACLHPRFRQQEVLIRRVCRSSPNAKLPSRRQLLLRRRQFVPAA